MPLNNNDHKVEGNGGGQGLDQESAAGRQRFIGIDGGGTKTACIIGDGCGHVLALCYGESSNVKSRPWDEVKQVLWNLIQRALELSDSDESQLAGIFLGLAGTDRPEDKQQFVDFLEEQFGRSLPIVVQNDAITALAAGTWGEAGIVLISGTGSIAYGYLPETGAYVRSGGWGYLLGDEGSGFAIGQQALQAIARQHDGRGRRTALTELVLNQWSLPDPSRIITHVYSQPNVRIAIADISKLTVAAAKEGDEVANAIIAEALEQLSELALNVKARLTEQAPNAEQPELTLCLSGGLFTDEWFMQQFKEHRSIQLSGLSVSQLSVPPVAGCYVLALKQAGIEITEIVKQRIEAWESKEGA